MGQNKATKQPPEIVPVPIRTPDDFLKLPDHFKQRIQRQLDLEELEEFLRSRGDT